MPSFRSLISDHCAVITIINSSLCNNLTLFTAYFVLVPQNAGINYIKISWVLPCMPATGY